MNDPIAPPTFNLFLPRALFRNSFFYAFALILSIFLFIHLVSPSGVAGVLVPIFIVIAILGSALGYYMYRNRRLKRNFIAFASRYSPATGAAILNAVSILDYSTFRNL